MTDASSADDKALVPPPSAGALCVVVGSDLRFFREGLVQALATVSPPMEVVGTPLPQTVQIASRRRPNVVLLDIGRGGESLIRPLVDIVGSPVVVLGIAETDERILALAEAGVAGYVTIDDGLSDVIANIRAAAVGESICSPRAAAVLLRRIASFASQRRTDRPTLTSREYEIAKLAGAGLSNREIADNLVIQLATVKNHVHKVLEKLDVTRRAEIAQAIGSSRMTGAEVFD